MFSLFRTAIPSVRWLWLCALPVLATAQTTEPAPAPQTPEPQAYASVFDGYKPYTDEPVLPWAQANAAVAHIGGWRAYAKEAAQPDTNTSESAGGSTPTKTQHQHHNQAGAPK